jgi:hypothetical protein
VPLNPIELIGGLAIGEGVGMAIGDVVEPQLRVLRYGQSAKFAHVPLPGELAARLLAQSRPHPNVNLGDDAKGMGFDADRFAAMVEAARVYPSVPEALMLWRRRLASAAQVYGWTTYQGFSDSITKQLVGNSTEPGTNESGRTGLFWDRLDPAVVATAIQRSIIPDAGILPKFSYPSPYDPAKNGVLTVASFATPAIATLDEARDGGIDHDRLLAMTALVGLPLSLEQAASAHFRGLIDKPTFARAVAEGNTRVEWGPVALEQAREILTANQYAELQLRGFLTEKERRIQTQQHGMRQDDSDLLFDLLGRSVNVHQIVTGEARGGQYKAAGFTLAQQEAGIPPAFRAALQRGNLRPEYYSLAYANRYTYPSFFAIRALLQGGVFTADQGYQILLEMGWKPTLARLVADHYGTGTGAVAVDPLVKSAHTRALTLLRNAYVARRVDDAFAIDRLNALGIAATVQTPLLDAWRIMQTIPGAGLTRAQVKKAFKSLPAEWPRDRALTELEDLGMEPAEAQTYLDE